MTHRSTTKMRMMNDDDELMMTMMMTGELTQWLGRAVLQWPVSSYVDVDWTRASAPTRAQRHSGRAGSTPTRPVMHHSHTTLRNCSVTRVHSRFGDRCFAAAGPHIWNNLPASLRDKEVSCTEFIRQLKTFMLQTDCGAS